MEGKFVEQDPSHVSRESIAPANAEEAKGRLADTYLAVRSLIRLLEIDIDDLEKGHTVNPERFREEVKDVNARLKELYEVAKDALEYTVND